MVDDLFPKYFPFFRLAEYGTQKQNVPPKVLKKSHNSVVNINV
jgi:hypothetical protein